MLIPLKFPGGPLFAGWGGGGEGMDAGFMKGRGEGAWNEWGGRGCAGDGQNNVISISQAYYALHYL